jgi:hypothetical protein
MTPLLLLTLTAFADGPELPAPRPTALVQSWITLMDQDTNPVADPGGYGDPEDDPGFKIRRARLGFEGSDDHLVYGVTLGVSSPFDGVDASMGGSTSVQLLDAYGGWSPYKGLWLVGGQQKVPVSREQLIASGDLVFTERAVSSHWLNPGRDVGVVADYSKSIARLRVGVFNGGGDFTGDSDAGKLFSARAEVNLGDANTYQTYGSVDGYAVGIGVDGFANSTRAVNAMGGGADLAFRMKGLAVLMEARFTQVAPVTDLAVVPGVLTETQRQGGMVQLGYTVGAWEPAVRYTMFDDNTDAEDGGDVAEALGGVTYHCAQDRVRAGLGYVMRTEADTRVIPNDSVRAWFQVKL